MPMVNLEALACGTPVVAFDTGGCPEAVNEACGAVVPKGDGQALCEAVLNVAPRKAELRPACLAQVERFDSQKSAEAYWALYQEVTK